MGKTIWQYPVSYGFGNNVPGYDGFHSGEDRTITDRRRDIEVTVNGVVIGIAGTTGKSTGLHLHIGRWVSGQPTNPNGGGERLGIDATVTQVDTVGNTANGKFVRVRSLGVDWVYLHLDSVRVKVGDRLETIQGGEMADKINLSTARILADGVLGRDGMDGRASALSGAVDGDLNQNHVGKDLTNEYIYFLYTSGEGSGFRNARVANTNTRVQLIEELRTALANEQKKPPKEVIKEVEKIIEKPVEVIKVETKYVHDEETKQNVNKILGLVQTIFDYFKGQYKTFSKYIKK